MVTGLRMCLVENVPSEDVNAIVRVERCVRSTLACRSVIPHWTFFLAEEGDVGCARNLSQVEQLGT